MRTSDSYQLLFRGLFERAGLLGIVTLLGLAAPSSMARAENHALLVGINDYQHVRDLRGSVNDILQIKRVLLGELGFDERNVQTLTNQEATKENILAALAQLAQQTRAGDGLLWYYSGHGFMILDQDGDEATLDPDDRYDEVLVPYDARPWPKERATDPNSTMLSDDEISQALSSFAGRRVVVVFDSCHSGSGTRDVDETGSRSLYGGLAPEPLRQTRGLRRQRETLDLFGPMVFLSASSPLQTASDLGEYEGQRHGAFTASLLRSIRKSGYGWHRTMSWEGLHRHVREDMLQHGFASQTPSIRARKGLGKRKIQAFFSPAAASEMTDLESPPGAFEIQLESRKYRFVEGETLEIAVQSERDGFLYIFDINADKNVTQLFPNRFSSQDRLPAGELRMVPAKQDPYQLRATKPYGKSVVVAIVTTEPWVEADQLQLPDGMCCNFQKAASERLVGSIRLRLMHPPRTAC